MTARVSRCVPHSSGPKHGFNLQLFSFQVTLWKYSIRVGTHKTKAEKGTQKPVAHTSLTNLWCAENRALTKYFLTCYLTLWQRLDWTRAILHVERHARTGPVTHLMGSTLTPEVPNPAVTSTKEKAITANVAVIRLQSFHRLVEC